MDEKEQKRKLLLTFPRKGTETREFSCGCPRFVDYYLHFPARGRKHLQRVDCGEVSNYYLHFPVRGRKLRPRFLLRLFVRDYYLPFPARGRKHDFVGWQLVLDEGIIIYISPQGDRKVLDSEKGGGV